MAFQENSGRKSLEELKTLGDDWVPLTDPQSGHTYDYSAAQQRSSWTQPRTMVSHENSARKSLKELKGLGNDWAPRTDLIGNEEIRQALATLEAHLLANRATTIPALWEQVIAFASQQPAPWSALPVGAGPLQSELQTANCIACSFSSNR